MIAIFIVPTRSAQRSIDAKNDAWKPKKQSIDLEKAMDDLNLIRGEDYTHYAALPHSSTSAKLNQSVQPYYTYYNNGTNRGRSRHIDAGKRTVDSAKNGAHTSSYTRLQIIHNSGKKKQSPYVSLWNIRILENFYDIKCSSSNDSGTRVPIFKIRRISNTKIPQNEKILHRSHASASAIRTQYNGGEFAQSSRRKTVEKARIRSGRKKYMEGQLICLSGNSERIILQIRRDIAVSP